MKRLLIPMFITLLASSPVRGQMAGNALLDYCKLDSGEAFWICSSYIFGVRDSLDQQNKGENNPFAFCTTASVDGRQVLDIVVKYLEDNPKWRHFPAWSLIQRALHNAFPC